MKISFSVLINLCCAAATAQGQDQSYVFHNTTQADVDRWHAEYVEYQETLPIQQRDIVYIYVDKQASTMTPAYLDEKTLTAYEWKGVVLQPNQVARLARPNSTGSGFIIPIDLQKGYQIKYIDPPIRYIALAEAGKYGVGYYDRYDHIFYEWNGVILDRDQLPANVETKHLIISADTIGDTSTINPPPQ